MGEGRGKIPGGGRHEGFCQQVRQRLELGHLIGGEEVFEGRPLERRNPSDLEDLVARFPEGTKDTLRKAALKAREAFAEWSRTPAPVRGQVLFNLAKILEREKPTLTRLMVREVGKTFKEAAGDVQEAIDTAIFFASEGRRLYGQTVPSEMRDKELFTFRRPLGVVGMITAGNFPIAVPSWKLIPAVLTGNTVVWKPSDDSPALSYIFVKLFEEAGLPPGVINLVFGGGKDSTGQWLVELMDEGLLNKFAFTGSTKVGRWIGEVAGRNLIRPTLELGGKNPLVVMRDADLDLAVEGAWWSAFATGGQRCTSAGNILVDAPIYEEFKRRFLERAEATRREPPPPPRGHLRSLHQRKALPALARALRLGEGGRGHLASGPGAHRPGEPLPPFPGRPRGGAIWLAHGLGGPARHAPIPGGDLRPHHQPGEGGRDRGGHRGGQQHPLRPFQRHLHPPPPLGLPLQGGHPRRDDQRQQHHRGGGGPPALRRGEGQRQRGPGVGDLGLGGVHLLACGERGVLGPLAACPDGHGLREPQGAHALGRGLGVLMPLLA